MPLLTFALAAVCAQEEVPKNTIKMGIGGAQFVFQLGVETATLGARAVFLASKLGAGGERLVTTGTLKQTEGESFDYSEEPSDRLRIEFANETWSEFTIRRFDGNLNTDWQAFLSGDHELKFRIKTSTKTDLTISSRKKEGALKASASGEFLHEEVRYKTKMSFDGETRSEVGSDFTTQEEKRSLRGTLTAEGFSLSADQSLVSQMIYNSEEKKLVQNTIATLNDSWTVGESQFRLADAEIRRAFVNQKPSDFDYWKAKGTLRRDGVVYGRIKGKIDKAPIRIWLEVEGKKIELESWR